jgi:hypothetical protein
MFSNATWKLILPALFLLFGLSACAVEPPATKPAAKPRVLVTISKETTYITEPLRPDGYPDYIAALNQLTSKGVTPENNAAVLFVEAEGLPYPRDHRRDAAFFELLGVQVPPDRRECLVDVEACVTKLAYENSLPDGWFPHSDTRTYPVSEAVEQQETAMRRPWSEREYPFLAKWLAVNEKPITLVAAASERPRWYYPIVADRTEPQIGVLLRAIGGEERFRLVDRASGPYRCAGRVCVVRAMLRLREGKADKAWQDLLTCHRLARLISQGPGWAWVAVAAQIESLACRGDQSLLRHGYLTRPQIVKIQSELAGLSPMARLIDKIDFEERCVLLDAVTTVARRSPASLRTLLGIDKHSARSPAQHLFLPEKIDWDIVLRVTGSWCERILAAYQRPTHTQRIRAMTQLNDELQTMAKALFRPKDESAGSPRIDDSPTAISKQVGQVFIATLSPAFVPARTVEDCAAMQQALTGTAFALAAYRADHDSYPEKLATLVPKYLKELPKDIFNDDRDLHYTRDGDGYLLYSVGSNGKDDGGRGQDDRKSNEDWDDLAVRMSANRRP